MGFAQPYLVNRATKPASTFYSYELKLPAGLQQVTGHLASKTPPRAPLTQEAALIMSSLNTPESPQQRPTLPVCPTYLMEVEFFCTGSSRGMNFTTKQYKKTAQLASTKAPCKLSPSVATTATSPI